MRLAGGRWMNDGIATNKFQAVEKVLDVLVALQLRPENWRRNRSRRSQREHVDNRSATSRLC